MFYKMMFSFWIFMGLWNAVPAAQAQPQDTMSMPIHVDESAPSAMEAKATALTNGERQAFFLLMERLAPKEATEMANKVNAQQIAGLVASFDVENEKLRAGRYQADITYHFDPDRIQKLLKESKGLVPGLKEDALLILPLYHDAGVLKLWESDNHWRNALNGVALEKGRGKLVMPFGDPQDTLMIDDEVILAGDKTALTKMAERYGTKNVVIATAHQVDSGTAKPAHIQVSLRRPDESMNKAVVLDYEAQRPTDTKDLVLMAAARDVAQKLVHSTKQYSLFYDEEAQKVKARVLRAEYRHSREWMILREHFNNLPYVDYQEMGAVSPNYAQLTLYFRGSDSLIHRALMARGLVVKELNDYWVVSLR